MTPADFVPPRARPRALKMDILQGSKLARPRVFLPLLALIALSIGGYAWLKKPSSEPAQIEASRYSKSAETTKIIILDTDQDAFETSGKLLDLCEKSFSQACQHLAGDRTENTPVQFQALSIPKEDLSRFTAAMNKLGRVSYISTHEQDLRGEIADAERKLAALTAQQQKIAAQRDKAGAGKRQRAQLEHTLAELAAGLKLATETRAQLTQRSARAILLITAKKKSSWKLTLTIG